MRKSGEKFACDFSPGGARNENRRNASCRKGKMDFFEFLNFFEVGLARGGGNVGLVDVI